MSNITLFTFLALLASFVFSAPIEDFTPEQDGSLNSRQGGGGVKLNSNSTISHIARNDYPSAGDVVITFYARGGDFFQQTFPIDGNPYVIDNPLKISHLVAEGKGFCAITGEKGSFTRTRDELGPVVVSPESVVVWGQCSTGLPEEGWGLGVVPRV
ncbi:b6c21f9e-f7e8-4329-bcf7-5ba9f93f6755 [Sclerotinia trifoliorum]|uniref:B6c21f9e-f7e8-4329-bcf7-5ba9f93f6755 n=1 Tax=Sclerotinia trifoliorum TaxID=28548 RepID=A0A8H2W4W0_9HELO|nr:b6c21f9e-f7e8-4329-bcf7-5ba9f93f6755 [Sclerotinia trifoliorum]